MIRHYETNFSAKTLFSALFKEKTSEITDFFRKKFGKEVILTSSGSSAIYIALKDIEEKSGSGQVITSNYSCKAIPRAIIKAGFRPIFVDIDLNLSMNKKLLLKAIKENKDVKAIIAWHPEGFVFDRRIFKIAKRYKIPLIEDCASSLAKVNGKLVGGRGDYAVFSFRTGKLIHGGGGALISKDRIDISLKNKNYLLVFINLLDLFLRKFLNIKKVKAVFDHFFDHPGNEKMSKAESYIVYSQLENMDRIRTKRIENYNLISKNKIKNLMKLNKIGVVPCPTSIILLKNNRKDFVNHLKKNGILISTDHSHVNSDVLDEKFYGDKNSRFIASRICHLPVHEFLSNEDVGKIKRFAK
ncbi:DegT/DnrJ/EryC1/StrS family aminotransferase [Candidatus Pacearchaeota archaeon]|nr:DegT/DnrJ/EryC1/StrS family aminotransferase [Candidatus Pacearchaeota archaeon]